MFRKGLMTWLEALNSERRGLVGTPPKRESVVTARIVHRRSGIWLPVFEGPRLMLMVSVVSVCLIPCVI